MNSTKVTQAMRINHWASIVHECSNSGMKAGEWLAEHGINRNTYYYWHKRLQDICTDEILMSDKQLPTQTFIQLPEPALPQNQVSSESSINEVGAIVHGKNFSVEILNSATTEFITKIMEVMVSA